MPVPIDMDEESKRRVLFKRYLSKEGERNEDSKSAFRSTRTLSEEAEDDEAIMRSMARRKRKVSAAELEPKVCREPGCEKEFKRPCDLTKHEKTHLRPWKCPVTSCKYHDYGWPTEKEMDRHHNDKHSAAPLLWECPLSDCTYKSKRESNWKQHMEKAHGWEYIRSKTNSKRRVDMADVISAQAAFAEVAKKAAEDKKAAAEALSPALTTEAVANSSTTTSGGDSIYWVTRAAEHFDAATEMLQRIETSTYHFNSNYHERMTENDREDQEEREHPKMLARKQLSRNRNPSQLTAPRPTRSPPENRRKVLRVLLQNKEQIACPDSGSEKNIMSETFANQNNLPISRTGRDIKQFELGSGKIIRSMGRVSASVELLGSTLGRKRRWFYIFPTCPVPLILGMAFLAEAEILTKNRHMLENCPSELSNISSLLWIGSPRNRCSPRNRMKCCLDGRNLVGIADTGSDLNFMSLHCAKREGFYIDTREEARRCVQLGDGTEAETIGQVYVSNLSLNWREPSTEPTPESNPTPEDPTSAEPSSQQKESFSTVFHVLPGLPYDVILGRDLLYEMDAFNHCPDLLCTQTSRKSHLFELNILISRRKKKLLAVALPDPKEVHDDERHMEILRRSNRDDEIARMPSDEQEAARSKEVVKSREWDCRHTACIYCCQV